jgi:Tfp pilus assembly protein PilO
MKKINKKYLDYIIISLIILFQLGAIFSLAKLIDEKTNSLLDQKHELLALEDKDKSLLKLHRDYTLIQDDLSLIEKILPNKKGVIDLINILEKEASQSGLQAKVNFSDKAIDTESEQIKSLNFSLNLKGSYSQILNFAKKIEDLPQVVVMQKLNILSPAGISGENNAILILRCYIDPKF